MEKGTRQKVQQGLRPRCVDDRGTENVYQQEPFCMGSFYLPPHLNKCQLCQWRQCESPWIELPFSILGCGRNQLSGDIQKIRAQDGNSGWMRPLGTMEIYNTRKLPRRGVLRELWGLLKLETSKVWDAGTQVMGWSLYVAFFLCST